MRRPSSALARANRHAQQASKITQARNALLIACVLVAVAAYLASAAPASIAAPTQRATGSPTAPAKPDANLLQLMRGLMFAQSNVIFAGQTDVSTIPHDALPAISPNPLTSVYGGWEAVENASLALAESAKLLLVAGRTCANGKPVPAEDPEWAKYTATMHDAALEAYKAAHAKSTDDMATATADVSAACASCHNVYRSNRAGQAARCTATAQTTPQPAP